MTIPVQFLTRIAIPVILASLLMDGNGPDQAALYDKIQEESDRVLSLATGEGEGPTEIYDYIIIGAGAAGAVLAKRLTESGADSVLVLEAGGDPNPISEVPMAITQIFETDMFLDYKSVPQLRGCFKKNGVDTGGVCGFARGRALGGSSSINGLVYNRCQAKDYDLWANFVLDPIWNFNSVVDAFRAIENYHGFYEDNPGPNHGTSGEIYIGKIEFLPGADTLYTALSEAGYQTGDLMSFQFPSGFAKVEYNLKDGLRWSTYHGFIQPILDRENLKIYRYAWATKIHLDETKRAVGVTYNRHGRNRYVSARKEIIVAAGAIDTPKLMMLSGLGPREHLSQHGIETVVDLPAVGDHFQDHAAIVSHRFALNTTFGIANYTTPETINEYLTNMTGPLVSLAWYDPLVPHLAHGYFPSKLLNDPTWPDIYVYINEQLVQIPGQGAEENLFFELESIRTNQTGTIRLASNKPEDPPLIDPKFLHDNTEIDRMVEGIEEMVNFFLNSPTYQALGIKWSEHDAKVPECNAFTFPSREYWQCYVILTVASGYHPTSSCRMGPDSSVAVVDSRLRVFGTTGLRIVDASVMPFVPSGNTNIPSMMIGEMGARIILNQI